MDFYSDFFNIGRGYNIYIRIKAREYKLSQFADDTTLLLDGSDSSLRAALNLLDQFAKFSGLKPNIEKTKCIWIGSMKNSNQRVHPEKSIEWTNGEFTLLGISYSTRLCDMIELNYNKCLDDINTLMVTETIISHGKNNSRKISFGV